MEYGTVRSEDEEGPVFQLRLNKAEAKDLEKQIKGRFPRWFNNPLERLRVALDRFVEANS